MKPAIIPLIAWLLLAAALSAAIILDPAWYRYLAAGTLYLLIWRAGQSRRDLPIIAFLCGLAVTATLWQVSSFAGLAALYAVTALFLIRYDLLTTREDAVSFLLFAALSLIAVVLTDLSPSLLLTAAGILLLLPILGLAVKVAEFRLIRNLGRGEE